MAFILPPWKINRKRLRLFICIFRKYGTANQKKEYKTYKLVLNRSQDDSEIAEI
jgi:hypothetical protein